MCGIFGTILHSGRQKQDMGILRALTLANRERGKESLGFFDSCFDIYKSANDPLDVLQTEECTEWLEASRRQSWFTVGHTRYSTRGKVCDANAHPFEYGDVIGSHNGIIDAPFEFDVDSEYCIHLMNETNSDYQNAFADEWGYWTLAWYDRRDEYLYLTVHDNTCGLVDHNGAWYFSSDPEHLATVVGCKVIAEFADGDTVRFNKKGEIKWLPKFKSTHNWSYKHDSRTSGSTSGYDYSGGSYSYNSGTGTVGNERTAKSSKVGGWPENQGYTDDTEKYVNVNDPNGYIREYDDDFKALWEEYATNYES